MPFVPLTALPLSTVLRRLGRGIELALLGWLLWRLLTRVAGDGRGDERTLLVAASIAAPPLALALLQGSFSLLVTVALLEVYLALRAGGDRAAAAWLVVASSSRRRCSRRASRCSRAAMAGRGLRRDRDGVLVAAATAVMGVGIWSSYLGFFGDYVGSFDVFSVRPSVMWNLRGTLSRWSGPEIARRPRRSSTRSPLWASGALVAVAWLWRAAGTRRRPSRCGSR